MRRDDYDDGRTVADMSALPERRWRPAKRQAHAGAEGVPGEDRPWETQMTRQERLAAVFGAMGAALLIGLIYLAAFGIVIFLLLKVWGA